MSSHGAPCTPAPPGAGGVRPAADKWFRDPAGAKFFWNGTTYGPFKPNSRGEPWPEDAQLRTDLAHIAALGFNMVRVYELPTAAVLQTCAASGLRLLAGVPWTQHVDFLTDKSVRRDAISRVAQAARRLAHEPCVAGLLIGNEIDKTLVRWMGPGRVRTFLEKLIAAAKAEAPLLPVAYANYPSTEYLAPRNADFNAFNVFLENRDDFARYVRHLQAISDDRPLVIAEFGLDAKPPGEAAQAEAMRWEMEGLRRIGAAGNFWFSYTDEWQRGGREVTDWAFGLVTRDRRPKQACALLPLNSTCHMPHSTLEISAIVCTRNGAATLRECLTALGRQTHPRFEVLVIDDGSTDDTPLIAREFPFVKYHRQDHAGLSAARNLGVKFAQGEIVAFTDDDCAPDEDWLLNLSAAFDDDNCVAAGGPNLPPSPRTRTETVVASAPGAPAHVLASDLEAEHLPGCNLAIRKSALEAVGGFREEFMVAGDDVDVCWRLQAAGHQLCFVPSAVVWHHRRATVAAFLRQQRGYGFAEAQLIKRWPERFAWLGGARWRGAIYGKTGGDDLAAKLIDFGPGGSALFPTIYATHSRRWTDAMSGLPSVIMVLALLGMGIFFKPLLLVAAVVLGSSIVVATIKATQRCHDRKSPALRGRFLLALLCWLQPVARDFARVRGMIAVRAWPRARRCGSLAPRLPKLPGRFGSREWAFWIHEGSEDGVLLPALREVCADSGAICRPAGAHESLWDVELRAMGMSAFITTVTEYHERGGRLLRARCSRPKCVLDRLSLPPIVLGSIAAVVFPIFLALIATVVASGTTSGRSIRSYVGFLAPLAVMAIAIGWDLIATRNFHGLLHRAAAQCGLQRDEKPDDSPLAVLPAPTKLPEHAP